MRRQVWFAASLSVLLVWAGWAEAKNDGHKKVLMNFGPGFDVRSVDCSDCSVSLGTDRMLHVRLGHSKPWPGVTLKAPGGRWDLSRYQYVLVNVANLDVKPVTVYCRVDNPGADGVKNCVTGHIRLEPGKSGILWVQIFPSRWRLSAPLELIGMRGYPVHAGKIDTSNVTQMIIFLNRPKQDHALAIGPIHAAGRVQLLDTRSFLPFIDEFGQFRHSDWPGKTHSVQQLVADAREELKQLNAYSGPPGRDKYGGWKDGPKLSATGHFYVRKFRGKWWLVDPEGHLFWSHGVDCVRSANPTPITDREHYFQNLPESNSPFAQFYGTGSWAPHGYYKDHSPYKTYDFSQANLWRKYGSSWKKAFAEVTQRRLRSWGFNTIGNWSDSEICLMRRTPYVATVSFSSRPIEGSEGYWGKFFDVFDPSFRQALRKRLAAEKNTTAEDPWCLGYFVHNELAWGDEVSLAIAALRSPAEQPAKQLFIADLKAKYHTIDKINTAWATDYTSWEQMLQARQVPDKRKAWEDLMAFYTKIAETYFRIIREELKAIAPNKLYLGCRFAWANDRAIRAAAKFCDVISFNRYSYSVEDLKLPQGVDKPVIIGEFHFGALDRGLFHTGLRRAEDQQDRAEKYKSYVLGALANRFIVGTHWFQYKDQPTTGRGDGENYQIGFIDICDKPYPEIVDAARQVGYNLYKLRLGGEASR